MTEIEVWMKLVGTFRYQRLTTRSLENRVSYISATLKLVHRLQFAANNFYTNASKLTEKYFLDLRNLFSNQENRLTEKNFLVPSARKFDLNQEQNLT